MSIGYGLSHIRVHQVLHFNVAPAGTNVQQSNVVPTLFGLREISDFRAWYGLVILVLLKATNHVVFMKSMFTLSCLSQNKLLFGFPTSFHCIK